MKAPPALAYKIIRYALTLGLAVFFIVLLAQNFSWDAFFQAWSQAHRPRLAACFLLGLLTTVLRSARFRYFFPHTGSLLALYAPFALMRLINMAMPFRSGELVFLGLLKRLGLTPTVSETLPVWGFLRVADFISLALLLILPCSYFTFSDSVTRVSTALPLIIFLILMAMVAALFAISKFPIHRLPGLPAEMIGNMQKGVLRLKDLKALVATASITLLLWVCMGWIIALAITAFDPTFPYITSFAVAFALLAFSMLPIHTPMGIGTADAGLVFFLHLAGMDPAAAVILAASVRILLISIVLADGLIGGLLLIRQAPAKLA